MIMVMIMIMIMIMIFTEDLFSIDGGTGSIWGSG
jgi:hypothetical protein